ncbi:phage holin, lambda family [Testudinibacter sp. TR-2022]|uniref:phage holin, lambda family n=1 Tax=Testudinibacter sp. TR-2022 TaxID=2585029 RepID=UPI0022787A6A|nr:phage holin, lambda family [Testudinibacter sp. TR-2022]
MPERDPNLWLIIWGCIQQNYNAISGFSMAFFMSMLRGWLLKQNRTYRHRLIDSTICGCLALSSESVLAHFGLSGSLMTFIGAAIGFAGAEKIREFLFKFINKRVERVDNDEQL